MKKDSLIKRLKKQSRSYKTIKGKFSSRLTDLKSQFKLSPEQLREVDFGIIIPADRSLQKYTDMVNSDESLNALSDQLFEVILKGCTEIFMEIIEKKQYIPGYDLDEFIKNPVDNTQEIVNLMQGFGGYEHIHCIREKITLEIPARRYISKHKPLHRAVKFWLKTVKEFSLY